MVTADWSPAHRGLRRLVVLISVAIFLISRLGLRPASEDPMVLGLTMDLSRPEFVLLLTILFVIVFWNFIARSRAELTDMGRYAARLGRTVQHVAEVRNKTAAMQRSFHGAMLADRLKGWDEALRRVSVMPPQTDYRQVEKLRVKLERFELLGAQVNGLLASLEAGSGGALAAFEDEAARQQWKRDAEEVAALLEYMGKIGRDFEERREALREAIGVAADVLKDARDFFSNEEGKGAEDLNVRLAQASDDIRALEGRLKVAANSWRTERFLFGLTLPAVGSLLLVIASADVVLAGIEDILQRLAP